MEFGLTAAFRENIIVAKYWSDRTTTPASWRDNITGIIRHNIPVWLAWAMLTGVYITVIHADKFFFLSSLRSTLILLEIFLLSPISLIVFQVASLFVAFENLLQ